MTTATKTIYNALPKLPGFSFPELNEAPHHGRKQYCVMASDGTTKVLDAPEQAYLREANATCGTIQEGCGIPVQVILDHFPQWKTLDNKVLRFWGYYVERVDESMVETSRVRKVKLHFFLSDGTLSITESPSVANSGLRRGLTVSRCKLSRVDVFSLAVGGTLTCRGQTYTLMDCDAATREFYEILGMPQPEPQPCPVDAFECRAEKVPRRMDEQHVEMRRVVEVQAAAHTGTHASLLTPDERAKARDFYAHDGEVLRLYATWADRQFRLQYYIADGTLSIMCDRAPNDGRDPQNVFMRRSRIPKDVKSYLLRQETLNRPLGPALPYITADDLRTGTTVDVFTRPFYIYDCDAYTREYFSLRGVAMPAYPKPPTENDAPLPGARRRRAKEHEDTAVPPREAKVLGASSMAFHDDVPVKDPQKMLRFVQDVFRFAARMTHPKPTDLGRRFLVSYYLADDTISVYELHVRNSGHTGGKIFARRRVPGVEHPHKLQVGASIVLDTVAYTLEEMDERTQKYIEAGMPFMDDEHFHIGDIIAKAQQGMLQTFSRPTDAFRHYLSSMEKGLNRDNVREVFQDCGMRLTDGELESVMKRIDTDGDGWVSLADFTEGILGQLFMSAAEPHKPGASPVAAIVCGPIRTAEAIAQRAHAAKVAEDALCKFMSAIHARRTLLSTSLRSAAAETYDGHLGMLEFHDCIVQRLKVPFSESDMAALMYKLYYSPGVVEWTARRLSTQEIERHFSR